MEAKQTKLKRLPSKTAIKKAVGQGLLDSIDRLAKQVAKGNRNEEETRRWVVDVLRSAFGYKDDQLETEMKVLGKRVDIAIKVKEKVLMVIECKASNLKLTNAAKHQAANYAATLGSEWALVTNGQRWQLYYVTPQKGSEPIIVDVLDVELLDDDGISKDDIEMLYLLTEKALTSGETLETFHFMNATSLENILKSIMSKEALTVISNNLIKSYQEKNGVTIDGITPDFLGDYLNIYLSDEIGKF